MSELEWEDLPLWRPHIHHLSEPKVKCTSQAQQRLQASGLLSVRGITDPDGRFKAWEALMINHEDLMGRRAYNAFLANIAPLILWDPQPPPQPGPHQVFFGEASSEADGRIWLYDVPQHNISSRWNSIRNVSLPVSTFRCQNGFMKKITRCCPTQNADLTRVLVRHHKGMKVQKTYFRFWSPENNILSQYLWSDRTALLDTTTSQLRVLQARQRHKPHSVGAKWIRELNCIVPKDL